MANYEFEGYSTDSKKPKKVERGQRRGSSISDLTWRKESNGVDDSIPLVKVHAANNLTRRIKAHDESYSPVKRAVAENSYPLDHPSTENACRRNNLTAEKYLSTKTHVSEKYRSLKRPADERILAQDTLKNSFSS
ncbi:hypothetical protein KM043_008838 [Ampulex compressa]|nr:hypothetical protein KM043_008838 [Ampulex compressa]